MNGVRIGTFAGKIQHSEAAEIIFCLEFSLWILAFYGAKCRWGGEKAAHIVFRDDPPKGPGIGGSYGFSFE